MGSGVLLVLWPPDREKNIFGGLPPGGLLEAGVACRVLRGGRSPYQPPFPCGWERCSRSLYISLIVYGFRIQSALLFLDRIKPIGPLVSVN